MKRLVVAACLGVMLSAGCSSLQPAEPLPEDHWTRYPVVVPFMKIGRGLTNVVASPLDVPATVVRVTREQDDVGYGLLAGFAEGVGNFGSRLFAGVVETLSFPLVYDSEPYYQRHLGQRSVHKEPAPIP